MFATRRGVMILVLMFVATSFLMKSDGVVIQGETDLVNLTVTVNDRKGITGFNEEQREAILRQHNGFRAATKASNMPALTWDSELEKHAQNYVDQCKFEHNPNRTNVAGFDYVGENIYAFPGGFMPQLVVVQWYDEIDDYDYSSNTCALGKVCGDYTQVVWADSTTLGCGVKYCPRFNQAEDIGFTDGILVVCNYGPGLRDVNLPL